MAATKIGYARCSTDEQDLTAQHDRLRELGVADKRIYLDHGLTGTSRNRPGLDQALAAVRKNDTLVVTKLDRLARSVPDARAIGDDLAAGGVKLSLGGQVYDPTDPMGKMFYSMLAMFAEFESDLLTMRTREGMAVAKAKGKLKGRAPKLSAKQQTELRRMHASGDYSINDLAEVFTISRPTVYRVLHRVGTTATTADAQPVRRSCCAHLPASSEVPVARNIQNCCFESSPGVTFRVPGMTFSSRLTPAAAGDSLTIVTDRR